MRRPAARSLGAILLLIALLGAALACDSATNTGVVPDPPPFAPNGRLVGSWNVYVWSYADSDMVCSPFGCSPGLLETNGCLVTTDLTTDAAGVFSGVLSIDSVKGGKFVIGSCTAVMAWPTFARSATITGGVNIDPSSSDWNGDNIAFQIGVGSGTAVEALVGCKLDVPWTSFRMSGTGWMGDFSFHYPGSAFLVHLISPGLGGRTPFVCHGRSVVIEIDYYGELTLP